MRAWIIVLAALAAAGCAAPPRQAPNGYYLVEGSFVADRGPDGNSIFLDSPDGLILVDSGRHPAHRDKLLGYARARGQPIVALLNTHWHLDHSTGNAEILAAFPGAQLYATRAPSIALVA